MSNSSLIEVENNKLDNLDLNNLFEFSMKYSFDRLKQTIESLIYNQKYTNLRLTNLEHNNISLQERIEKQEVRVDNVKEQTNHIQNYNGDNELFKKSLDNLKTHLVQVEQQEIVKIEQKAQKQREELHMNIRNIYRVHYPNKEENERKETQNKKHFEKLDKQIKLMKKSIKKLKKSQEEMNKSFSLRVEDNIDDQETKIIQNDIEDEVDSNDKKTDAGINEKKKSKNNVNETTEKSKTNNDEKTSTNSKGNEKLLINIFNKSKIGKRFIDFDSNLPALLKLKEDVKDINETLGEKSFNESIKGLINKLGILEKSFEELNSKISDFDIFSLIAGKDKPSGGNEIMDVIKALFQGFEKKFQAKSQTNDDKLKKVEDNFMKFKNDLMIIRMHLEGRGNSNDDTKQGNEFNLNLSELGNLSNDKYLNEIAKLYSYIDSKFGELNFDNNFPVSSKGNEDEINNEINNFNNNSEMNSDEKMPKRIGDLEKNLKILYLKLNGLDKASKECAAVNNSLINKADKTEVLELRELINQTSNYINFLKENFQQLNDDVKIGDQVSWMKKKIEMISSTIAGLNISHGGEDVPGSSRHRLEGFKFVDVSFFNEFKNSTKKELEEITKRLDDGRNMLENDVVLNLHKKATTEELKSLEDFLISKLEELKHGSGKKFADKNEVSKSIRYLDTQVKHIMDVYIKKMEKGDNWLLAKKPFNGNFCASCENPIGELNDNNVYLPWNKVSNQHNDRIYRVGSGFSKMLQNLVIEGNDKHPDDTEYSKYHSRNKSNNQHTVTRLNSFKAHTKAGEQSMEVTTFDNLKSENTLHEIYDDPKKPKVTKIYKMKKKD